MYLSSLLIDVGTNPDRPRPGRLWLRNVYHVHQRLCMAFPSAERRTHDGVFLKPYRSEEFAQGHVHIARAADAGFLFRLETTSRDRVMILVQSAVAPDWHYAFQNAGYLLAAPPQVKTYQPDFNAHQNWRFRLVANPTKRLTASPVSAKGAPLPDQWKRKRVPVPPAHWSVWLQRHAERAGFEVDFDRLTTQPGYIQFAKSKFQQGDDQKRGARLRSVRFDGFLTVTDSDRFQKAHASGIGSAKAFGFGLLSVAPL